MFGPNKRLSLLTVCAVAALAVFPILAYRASAAEPQAQQAPAQAPQAAQVVGAIKAISGTTITLAPDKGGEVTVAIQPGARIVRVAPGQTDLKGAATLQLSDLQVGDRILVRGKASDDGKSIRRRRRHRHEAFRCRSQEEGGARRLAEARGRRLGQRG